MAILNITPAPNKIWLKLIKSQIGSFEISENVVSEKGEIVAIADGISYKTGDILYVKAWALDSISIDGEPYSVVDVDSKGILGKEK